MRSDLSSNTIRKEKTYDVLSIQKESGNGTNNAREKRHLQKNKMKKERKKETHVATGAPACRRTIERRGRGFNESMKTKTKQNKTNVTPEKDVMTSAGQTPGGYKFAPLVVSQQGRALGYPLFGPSRHVRAYRCMPLSSLGFLCNDPFRHEMFRPLFCRSAPPPFVLGCSHPLVGVDTESSEIVQKTLHPLFFLAPHTARAPHHFSEHHALRQSRILQAMKVPCGYLTSHPNQVPSSRVPYPVLTTALQQPHDRESHLGDDSLRNNVRATTTLELLLTVPFTRHRDRILVDRGWNRTGTQSSHVNHGEDRRRRQRPVALLMFILLIGLLLVTLKLADSNIKQYYS